MNKFFSSFLILASFALNAAKTFEHSIQSKLMDANFKLKVIVPDSYDGNKSFRQVFLLHGAGGDQNTWNGDNLSENMADKYNRIFILPTAGKTSWYNNHNQSENFIINEIIPFIDGHYKTIPDRWITGLSMGGFGAIRLGYKYPKLFSAIGGLSACIKPSQWTNKWNISSAMNLKNGESKDDHFTTEMIKKIAKDKRPLALLCGKADFFFNENEEAIAALRSAKISFYHEETQGAHNWPYWKTNLPKQLEFFEQQSKKRKNK